MVCQKFGITKHGRYHGFCTLSPLTINAVHTFAFSQVDAIQENLEKDKSNKPTWLLRRRNKSSMPRPKSTGYMGDFNILSAEDDVEDVSTCVSTNRLPLLFTF